MIRNPNNEGHSTSPRVARWCIWSVQNQTWLAGQIRIYIWAATAVVAFFTLAGVIAVDTALWSLFISGLVVSTAIWLLIRQRKIWLLNIQDPKMRQQALSAMVNYLNEVHHAVPRRQDSPSPAGDESHKGVDCVDCS